jgi:endonuclease I
MRRFSPLGNARSRTDEEVQILVQRRRNSVWALLCLCGLLAHSIRADIYDPPAAYYNTATGTGSTLKSQLNDIIDGHTVLSYDSARSSLQVTDADPNQAGHMLTVYDRVSLNVAAISGSPPGWNSTIWNREHTWPRSRGVGSSGQDDSDLFLLRPSLNASNGDRGNLNFGGAFGASTTGQVVTDGTNGTMWYPGNVEAGMIARQQFYGAVRYDGSDASTNNLELGNGNIADVTGTSDDPPPQLGDLARLVEWHFAAPPDNFERRRNQVIYDNYQHNRDPFIDHPEFVWSVFVNQANDSQLSIAGATVAANGSSTRNVDLGRVFVNGAVPAAQSFAINKAGNNGTYFDVTATGAATSSISGRLNAMRSSQTDSKSIVVGLNTTTSAAGLKSGTVTIDNLDITTAGGTGRGANDANDVFNVSLTVLDHATPSFTSGSLSNTLSYNFGNIAIGDNALGFAFDIHNLAGTAGFTADMDFDSIVASGNTTVFTTSLAASAGSLAIPGGASQMFGAAFTAASIGTFTATYQLNFSDENIAGALNKSITLTLSGTSRLAGDYNGDLTVDAADYTVWRNQNGQSVTAYASADGDGNGTVNELDYDVWRAHFGQSASAAGASLSAAVPEPSSLLLTTVLTAALLLLARQRQERSLRPELVPLRLPVTRE